MAGPYTQRCFRVEDDEPSVTQAQDIDLNGNCRVSFWSEDVGTVLAAHVAYGIYQSQDHCFKDNMLTRWTIVANGEEPRERSLENTSSTSSTRSAIYSGTSDSKSTLPYDLGHVTPSFKIVEAWVVLANICPRILVKLRIVPEVRDDGSSLRVWVLLILFRISGTLISNVLTISTPSWSSERVSSRDEIALDETHRLCAKMHEFATCKA